MAVTLPRSRLVSDELEARAIACRWHLHAIDEAALRDGIAVFARTALDTLR